MAAAVVVYQPETDILFRLLDALEAAGHAVFVFINGDVEAAILARFARTPQYRVHHSRVNVGLGRGLNWCVGACRAEGAQAVLLLDQDSEPDGSLPEALLTRLEQLQAQRPTAAIAPKLVPPPGSSFLPIRYDWIDHSRGEVLCLPTSGTLLDLAAWAKVGPFRDDYFIGGIDFEWSLRARAAGFGLVVDSNLSMGHRWGAEVSGMARRHRPQILRHSPLRNFYYVRNMVDILRRSPMHIGHRLSYSGRLAIQLALLAAVTPRSLFGSTGVLRAVWHGWNGRLGPA